MSKAVLVDITKCIGCGSCTVACRLWNDLKTDKTTPAHGENAELTDKNWTAVKYKQVNKDSKQVWRFVKEQCLHCDDPACVSVCMSKALVKTPEGPVVYHPNLCVGCRYCMLACPFEIPKYEWEKKVPNLAKCQMCASKLSNGEPPACASVCPTNALKFGEKNELLALAKNTIENNDSYVKHIYGEKEAGGTSWLYISDVPFEELGFITQVPTTALPHTTHEYLKFTPAIFLGGGALFTALNLYTKRRNKVAQEERRSK